MLEETQRLYDLTRNASVPTVGGGGPAPITHPQVFYKEYPRFETVGLPAVAQEDVSLERAWSARQSEREFGPEKLSLGDVSSMLGACRVVDHQREVERRTYPSAGARFPIEMYLMAFRVDGLEPGCYHYRVRTHELEVLWPADLESKTAELVSPFITNPSAAIVMTSVISRAEVKYGYKAYPFSYLEAGHMAQNILLASAGRGIGTCPIGGFVDTAIVELLDLTGDEIPVYVIAAGKAG
jgi:SagB-type dehydrogenase family enzyme